MFQTCFILNFYRNYTSAMYFFIFVSVEYLIPVTVNVVNL